MLYLFAIYRSDCARRSDSAESGEGVDAGQNRRMVAISVWNLHSCSADNCVAENEPSQIQPSLAVDYKLNGLVLADAVVC